MGYDDERATLETRFNTQWGSTTPVAWDNIHYKPIPEVNWVRFTISTGSAFQASLEDSPLHRHTGIITIGIFVPADTGTTAIKTLADTAAAIFRGWTPAGITCRSPYVITIGESDGWYQVNVTVPFYRDESF